MADELETRRCGRCRLEKSATDFNRHGEGLQSWCRSCISDYHRKRKRPREESVESDPIEPCEAPDCGDELYIMSAAQIPSWGVKIGRSHDSYRRADELVSSLPCDMVIHTIFPNSGHLEGLVHSRLRHLRTPHRRAREWFQMTPGEAIAAVAGIIYETPENAEQDSN